MTFEPRVDEPCHASWNAMTPVGSDGTRSTGRYCDSCRRTVLDLTGLGADQAQRLVDAASREETSDGTVCIRFVADEEGRIVYPEIEVQPGEVRAARLVPASRLVARARRALATAALPVALAACGAHEEPAATTTAATTTAASPAPVATWTVAPNEAAAGETGARPLEVAPSEPTAATTEPSEAAAKPTSCDGTNEPSTAACDSAPKTTTTRVKPASSTKPRVHHKMGMMRRMDDRR